MEVKIVELLKEWLENMPAEKRPSQNEIAKQSGVNQGTLSKYMNGGSKSPDPNTVAKLAKLIGITDMNKIYVLVIDNNEDAEHE